MRADSIRLLSISAFVALACLLGRYCLYRPPSCFAMNRIGEPRGHGLWRLRPHGSLGAAAVTSEPSSFSGCLGDFIDRTFELPSRGGRTGLAKPLIFRTYCRSRSRETICLNGASDKRYHNRPLAADPLFENHLRPFWTRSAVVSATTTHPMVLKEARRIAWVALWFVPFFGNSIPTYHRRLTFARIPFYVKMCPLVLVFNRSGPSRLFDHTEPH